MHPDPLIVLKFGSSVLRRSQDLPAAVHEIYRWYRQGYRVLAVVSALGGTTDRLLQRARRYGEDPNEEAAAALVATGEATAAALLGLALDRAGVPARVLDADQMGLRTEGPLTDSHPCGLDEQAIGGALTGCPVAVAPGFTGRLADGRLSLLGRGGSDLTALFLADRLGARRVRLIKDADGLYERDPNNPGPRPRCYRTLDWDEALAMGGGVVQEKALRFARAHGLRVEVAALGRADATLIGPGPAVFHSERPPRQPLRVALLGLGTVGSGVYWELMARPDLFEISSVVVRRSRPVPGLAGRVSDDVWRAFKDRPDVIVEVLGGRQPANAVIARALASGIDVVTANKAVVAEEGPRLAQLADRSGAQFLHAAAVGGAVPMLEAVSQQARRGSLRSLEGVFNGTSNYVLDRLAAGSTLAEALKAARASGFTETDASLDLDGTDVAQKLVLLARAGFHVNLPMTQIERRGIECMDPAEVRQAAASGQVVRLVGSLRHTRDGVAACVTPRLLALDHPLAQVRREGNGLVMTTASGGLVFLHGKGAGRWPTTEAVMADLMVLARDTSREAERALPSRAHAWKINPSRENRGKSSCGAP